MTAFNSIKTNNWPSASNDLEDFLVLELPLNDQAALTSSRRDIVAGSTVLHPKRTLANTGVSMGTAHTGVTSHALTFRGSSNPSAHLNNNSQSPASWWSNTDHYDSNDVANTSFADWVFDPPLENVTSIEVDSRHDNANFNPYYYQVYDENDTAMVTSPSDKTGSGSGTYTSIYSGSSTKVKRIKQYGGGGFDDFNGLKINGTVLNSSNGISGLTSSGTAATATYSPPGLGTPKKHYDENAVFSSASLVTPANLNFGTGDFTVECWVYPDSAGGEGGIFQMSTNTAGLAATSTNIVSLQKLGGGFRSYANDGSRQWSTSVVAGQWVHLALVRNSGTLRLYVNGVEDSTSYTDPRAYTCTHICVGGYYSANYMWDGAIQDLRAYKGVAKYTANFTPPGAILG